MAFLITLVAPVAALGLMIFLETLAEKRPLREIMVRAGWDLCVLALGASPGVFYGGHHPEDKVSLFAVMWGLLAIFLCFGVGIKIAKMKREAYWSPAMGLGSVFLGGMTLVLPTLALTGWLAKRGLL